jgi:hypothetical protein
MKRQRLFDMQTGKTLMSWTQSGVLAMALHAAGVKRNATQAEKNNAKNHTSP